LVVTTQKGTATATTVFHPAGDAQGFDGWLAGLAASARTAAGFVVARPSVHDHPGFDWALAVTFGSEDGLHAWLDSAERARILADGTGRGFWRSTTDVVIVDGSEPPPGVSGFRHKVVAGKEADFHTTQAELIDASSAFSGYEGTALFPPDAGDEWLSVVRFRTPAQLSAWLYSQQRRAVLGDLRSTLAGEFARVSSTTPFATTVRTENGRTLMTPDWKSAMVVLLVLYPIVMILSRFFGPVLDGWGAEPWLTVWLSNVVSVSALQWWLMPSISKPFQRWLDPVDGAGLRVSAVGAGVIIVGYVLTLAVFATVKWLQYWDFHHG
jgi:antibiotic biosynthesis monooxygenase (ABM) superfamily enzyme